MTHQQFLDRYNGEYLEVAGSSDAKNQCVDCANGYIRDVLGLPIIEWTNAIDFPKKAGDKYDYILNSPTNIPEKGDLVIFSGGVAGHISIFMEGNANRFKSFDENYPTGSPCHVQEHTYANVLGWLRVKPQVVPLVVDDKYKYDFGGEIGVQELGAVRSQLLDKSKEIRDLKQSISGYESANNQQTVLIEDLRKQLAEAQSNKNVVTYTVEPAEPLKSPLKKILDYLAGLIRDDGKTRT